LKQNLCSANSDNEALCVLNTIDTNSCLGGADRSSSDLGGDAHELFDADCPCW
jgi:hypothetical protein